MAPGFVNRKRKAGQAARLASALASAGGTEQRAGLMNRQARPAAACRLPNRTSGPGFLHPTPTLVIFQGGCALGSGGLFSVMSSEYL